MHLALLRQRQSACLSALVPVGQLSVWPRPKDPCLAALQHVSLKDSDGPAVLPFISVLYFSSL